MPGGAALIDAGRQITDARDLRRYFGAEQQTAGARLGALADSQLDGVGLLEVMDVDAVAAGQHLVDQSARILALGRQHAAVARRGRRACLASAARQRYFGVVGEGTVAHAGDHNRNVEFDRRRSHLRFVVNTELVLLYSAGLRLERRHGNVRRQRRDCRRGQ